MSSVSQPRNIDQKKRAYRVSLTPSSYNSLSNTNTPILSHSFPHGRRQSMARLGSPVVDGNSKLTNTSALSSASIYSGHQSGPVLIDAENPSFLSESKDEDLISNNANQYINSDGLNSEGGDIVHFINKKNSERRGSSSSGLKKTKSASNLIDIVESDRRKNSASGINVPGGFRREFMLTKMKKKAKILNDEELAKVPFLTRNFMEFLFIYGHFAGEDFEEDFEFYDDSVDSDVIDENSSLLTSSKKIKNYEAKGTTSTLKAFLIMLKSFIGTGIIFLPKGFSNGGLLFSLVMLLIFGVYSYYCYYILISAKIRTGVSSFGDIGVRLFGSWMKSLILFSLILTQIGFACAYIIFTSENLHAFFQYVIGSKSIKLEYFFILQGVIFIPLSFIRNVSKLSTPSLIANGFIFAGIFIILSFITSHLITNGVAHPIDLVINSKFSLFIGTAIFAFEGIGLIIPIQDSMRHPEKFPLVLALVLLTITILMVSVATIGYLSYGQDVKTAILLNLPQGNVLVQSIQLFYSLAILLSTPLQLFPAIAITQNYVFGLKNSKNNESLSGKSNLKIKWSKNLLRALIVFICINIAWFGADDLDKFVSFVGCFACIPLVYIYPPLLHLKSAITKNLNVQEEEDDDDDGYRGLSNDTENTLKVWIIDGTLVVIGLISMCYTSYQIIFG